MLTFLAAGVKNSDHRSRLYNFMANFAEISCLRTDNFSRQADAYESYYCPNMNQNQGGEDLDIEGVEARFCRYKGF